MPGRSATARKWRAGVLHAARAAAFLSIATGVNSILTALYPRYEPVYAYLISVVVVAWLSSALLGVTTAIVAVILYDWMFSPVRVVPSFSFVMPLTVAVALAIATRAMKIPVRPRAILAKPVEPPLLPAAEEPRAAIVRDDPRVADLTRQLAAANARAGDEEALRARLTDELEALRQTVAEQNGRWTTARREFEEVINRVRDTEARLSEAQQELEAAQRKAGEESERAARETALREQAEVASHASLQNVIADLNAKHEPALAEAKQRANELQKSVEAVTAKANALQRELDRTLASLSEEHARADRETKLRSQLEVAARQTLRRTADVSAGHQREANEAHEAARAAEQRAAAAEQRAATLQQAIDKLQSEVAGVRAQHEERTRELQQTKQALEEEGLRVTFELAARQKMADEAAAIRHELERLAGDIETERNRTKEAHAARETAVREAEEKLQAVVARYESGIAEAAGEKEAVNAELQKTRQTIEELQSLITEMESQREQMSRDFDANLQKIVSGITADHEHTIGEMLVEREAAKAELRRMNGKLQALTTEVESQREQMSRDFDANLQKIVTGITADHEHTIGEMLVEREGAKAELRAMNGKLQALQSALEEERRRANEEKAGRERLDAEWNEKLQKIVGHLTEDHEADVGEAMLQREAARAEVRSLSARVTALQQKLEEERERFGQAAERWQRRSSFPPTVEQPIPPAAAAARRHVVLVVHSDAGVRAMAKHSLEQAGYLVITAADGLEGLRTATQQKPDVVLAEAVMPKMNARELVQLLKSRPETANVKIVLISGSGISEKGADFRADEVIRDPANFNDLRNTLANVLTS